MSSPYNGANTFPVTITIPSDGDLATAASVNVSLEALADRTVNLQGFLNGTNAGPSLLNPTLSGTLTIFAGALHGDGTFLNISQPGETTRFLGGTVFSFGNLHKVDGIMSIQPGGDFVVTAGGAISISAGASATLNGTLDVFGTVVLHAPGYIQFRIFSLSPTPASQTLSIQNGDEFFIDPTTSNMGFVMSDPPSDGLRVRFSVVNATNTANAVNVQRSDLTSLVPAFATLGVLRWSAGYPIWLDIVSRGGRWECSAYGKY